MITKEKLQRLRRAKASDYAGKVLKIAQLNGKDGRICRLDTVISRASAECIAATHRIIAAKLLED